MFVSIQMVDLKKKSKNTFRKKHSITADPKSLCRHEPERRDAISQHYPRGQRLPACLPVVVGAVRTPTHTHPDLHPSQQGVDTGH